MFVAMRDSNPYLKLIIQLRLTELTLKIHYSLILKYFRDTVDLVYSERVGAAKSVH